MTTTSHEGVEEHCGNALIHRGHSWTTSVQKVDEDDHPTDWWEHVDALCEGNDDQDDPFDRFECCEHCAATRCPTRDGHFGPCRVTTCQQGNAMLGEPRSRLARAEVDRG